MMRKMMRKTSGISLSVKNKGIMMRKASAFFGATFQIPIKIASKYAIWQKWRFCRTANEKTNA